MRTNSSILLFLPLLDLVCLVPLQRWMGAWLWFFLVASALLGVGLLKEARRSIVSSSRGFLDAQHLSLMIGSQRTVLAGMLFLWPGIFSDLAAIMLLITSPAPVNQLRRDHPLRTKQGL